MRDGSAPTWADFARAFDLDRSGVEAALDKLAADHDVVLSPVLAHTTPPLGYLSPNVDFEVLIDRLIKYVSFTPANNASGSPALSLPLGESREGLPIGVQFSALQGGIEGAVAGDTVFGAAHHPTQLLHALKRKLFAHRQRISDVISRLDSADAAQSFGATGKEPNEPGHGHNYS